MTTNQYDYIIIGAGYNNLTPNPSPKGEGNQLLKKQSPRFVNEGLPDNNFQIFDFAEMRVS